MRWIFKAGILVAFGAIVLMSTLFYFILGIYSSASPTTEILYISILIVIWGVFLKQVYILWKHTYEGIEHIGLNFTLMIALGFSFAFIPLIDFDTARFMSITSLLGILFVWGVFVYYYSTYSHKERLFRVCVEKIKGKVISVEKLNLNSNKVISIEVEYLDRKAKINDLPEECIFKKGDKVNLKYNPKSKNEVILDLI